jgi:hypothetical protein
MEIGKVRKYNSMFFKIIGGLAQLARAFDWQSKGQEFDSPILHSDNKSFTD